MTLPLGQPVRFVLVGAGGYAVNLLSFAALYALGTPYVTASLLADHARRVRPRQALDFPAPTA
jgi:putative flippase GtrA